MKFDNAPTYTVAELERKARRLLDDLLGADFSIAVDVELMLERLEGIGFDLWPALKDNHQVEGMVARETATGKLWVFIDEALADRGANRYRMTVAEELAHVVLHRSLIDRVESPADFVELQRHQRWHEMDRNAKRFAAALLMPADRVLEAARELYPKMVAVAGFRDPEAVLRQLATLLASRFEVSPLAMRIRMKEYPAKVEEKVIEAMKDGMNFI